MQILCSTAELIRAPTVKLSPLSNLNAPPPGPLPRGSIESQRRPRSVDRPDDKRTGPADAPIHATTPQLAPGYSVYRRPRMAEEGVPANAELV